jgi:hypothetical protein
VSSFFGNRKSRSVRRLERQVKEWNRDCPVGTPVTVSRDDGSEFETKTRSAARVLSGHTAVIWVDGIAGCYSLDRVRRRTPGATLYVCSLDVSMEVQ